LLIVGPFDAKAKLAVPFVQTIHLASNPVGDRSRLVTLTREQMEAQEFEEEESREKEELLGTVAPPTALGT
jgi:hypothetical protein